MFASKIEEKLKQKQIENDFIDQIESTISQIVEKLKLQRNLQDY